MPKTSINTCFSGILLLSLLLAACSPTRKLQEGEFLLNRNVVIDNKTGIDKADLESYIKQKPNRKILGMIRFHLWLYNLANKQKVEQKRILKNKKIDEKNVARLAEGKQPLSKDRLFFGEWLLQIGEPPVVLDSALTHKSVQQMKLYLNNKGYFNSEVHDSVVPGHKYANVFYVIKPSKPCVVRNIRYNVQDEGMRPYIMDDTMNCLIKKGKIFDVDVLQKERERITTENRNNGYYHFTKDYIYYKADSFLATREIDLVINIKKYSRPAFEGSDSIVEENHVRHYLNNIYIVPDYNQVNANKVPVDTLEFDTLKGIVFLLNEPLKYKPWVIAEAIYLSKGDLYQAKNTEDTYRRLTEIRAFRSVNIRYKELSGTNKLDCYIRMSPVLKQAFLAETEGTNTSGNLGIAGSLVYQNKNTFRGAEVLEIKLKGGVEAQQLINKSSTEQTGGLTQIISEPFNTIQFGPEANLTIPRPVFPFSIFKYGKYANPKSTFTTAFNYQHRPDYSRWILNFSHGLTYKETATQRYTFTPLEINFVKVKLQPSFRDALLQSNDLYLLNSYTDHLTPASRFTYIYNNQDIKRKHKNFSFFKGDFEYSGIGIRAIHDLAGAEKVDGSYRILDIVYSHYVRIQADYRFYLILSQHDRLVFRTAFGEGIALQNLNVLPFEKSFYGGSSNGIRAWNSRSLGPGAYVSSFGNAFDQTGDIQLEGNIEYRFNLFKQLNGAFFLDGGNIWLRKPDAERPGGEFDFDNFYDQFALGGGVGARLDFGFFIIRLDFGLKLRDPQFSGDERWVIKNISDAEWKKKYQEDHGGRKDNRYPFGNVNLGIGYPF